MNDRYLLVAMREELKLPAAQRAMADGYTPIVTGVGAVNIIRATSNLPKSASILNVGYCGSTYFPVGDVVRPGAVRTYHPNIEYEEPVRRIKTGELGVTCYTAGDFVTSPGEKFAVYDMELAYIAALFRDVAAVKYVSDGNSIEQFEGRAK